MCKVCLRSNLTFFRYVTITLFRNIRIAVTIYKTSRIIINPTYSTGKSQHTTKTNKTERQENSVQPLHSISPKNFNGSRKRIKLNEFRITFNLEINISRFVYTTINMSIRYTIDILKELKNKGFTTYRIRKERLLSEGTIQKFQK